MEVSVQRHPPAALPSRKQDSIHWIGSWVRPIIDVITMGNCEIIKPDVT